MNDFLETSPNVPHTGINRRKFLQFLSAAGLAAITARFVGNLPNYLNELPKIDIDKSAISRFAEEDLGLGDLGRQRTEFFGMWPYTRTFTAVNNALAAEKLKDVVLKEGQEYSLGDLLDLRRDYSQNTDPNKGYVKGTYLTYKNFWVEAAGLSLTATAVARALAFSPVMINSWVTHDAVDSATGQLFFDPRYQPYPDRTSPAFSNLGTDASLYISNTSREEDLDFTSIPLEDLSLRMRFADANGNPYVLPNLTDAISKPVDYYALRNSKPTMYRVAVGANNLGPYKFEIEPIIWHFKSADRPGFKRRVFKDGKVIAEEKVFAFYGKNGKYVGS